MGVAGKLTIYNYTFQTTVVQQTKTSFLCPTVDCARLSKIDDVIEEQ